MERVDKDALAKILAEHKAWLEHNGGAYADLSRLDLRGIDLRGVNLHAANLRKADLCGADLRKANLRKANMRKADFCEADLCGANLRGADLYRVNLRGANLRDADLRDADLRWANLREANLRGADLRRANLRGADLRRANLRGADLSQKIVQVGPIGNRSDYMVYRVDEDIVQGGFWREYAGGSLADFMAQVDETYPEDNKDGAKYRSEYLAAIAMFRALREDYLKDSQRERMAKGEET